MANYADAFIAANLPREESLDQGHLNTCTNLLLEMPCMLTPCLDTWRKASPWKTSLKGEV